MARNGGRGTVVGGPAVPALRYAHVVGWGKALPARVLSNKELEAIVETSDEWIVQRTGIKERRIARQDESTTDLAFEAAKKALQVANILPTDVDLIVVATSTPEHIFPSTASLVQDRLGAQHAGAYDLSAACSGFVYALDMASNKVRTGDIETAVVIGAETMSRVMNWSDRGTCILFGDGAGAVVIRGKSEPGGILASELRSDGAGWDLLGVPTLGSRDVYLPERAAEFFDSEADRPNYELHRLHMNGREVYRFATRVVPESLQYVAKRAGIKVEDIDLIVPHQANQRIIDYIAKQLKIPEERIYSNVAKYGNTSAASIPIALVEAIDEGRIHPGDYVAITGFGGGLSWASMLLRWEATAAQSDKLMDARRGVIYWYAVRRRGFVRWWRWLMRWLLPHPHKNATLRDLQKKLDEQDW